MDTRFNPWKILDYTVKYANRWIGVTEYNVINPSGGNGIYGKVHFKNIAIGIFPLDEAYNTYLVGQYRFTIDKYSWEIPEGGCPVDEEPLQTAKRELLEETGLGAGNWERIMQMHLSNSVTDEYCEVFLATGIHVVSEAEPEETEQLQVKKIPFDEAYKMVMDNEITDAITVAAVLKIKLMIQEGRL